MAGSSLVQNARLNHADDRGSGKPTVLRYFVLAALFGLAAFTYLDRVCISLATPWIIQDLGLTPVEMGMVFSIFAAAYAMFEVPTGWLGDRLGPRRVLSRVLAWWSVFTSATGFAWGFSSLLTVRFLFGVGEAGAYPNMTRAVAAWFPEKRRGMAMGTIWMGSRLGAAITPPIVLFLLQRVGWRATFYILGVAGVALAVLWYFWFRDKPGQMRGVNAAEIRLILGKETPNSEPDRLAIPFKTIVCSRNVWALNSMYFTLGFTYYLYISWFPTYLVKHRGVSVSHLAVYASMPLVFSTVAAMAGGLVTDRLIPWLGLAWARRSVGMFGSAAAAFCLTSGILTQDLLASVILISLAAAASDFTLAAAWASCADIGATAAGTVSGAMNMVGNIGSALSPALMGLWIEKTSNWNMTFFIAAGLNVVAMLLWLFIHADRKLVPRSESLEVR